MNMEDSDIDENEYPGPWTKFYDQLYKAGMLTRQEYGKFMRLAFFQDTFECNRCNNCCRDMDSVAFTLDDLKVISRKFGMNGPQFIRKYQLRRANYKGERPQFLLSWKEGGSCPFHDGHGCTIYDVRPEVCRTYPFLTFEGIQKTLAMEHGFWFYGAQCPASVEHANEIMAALGQPPVEPDEETKAKMRKKEREKSDLCV